MENPSEDRTFGVRTNVEEELDILISNRFLKLNIVLCDKHTRTHIHTHLKEMVQ